MKKDLVTEKSGRIGIIIKAALLFFAVSAAVVILFALVMYIFADNPPLHATPIYVIYSQYTICDSMKLSLYLRRNQIQPK